MIKKTLLLWCVAASVLSVNAQKLSFRTEGTFKIAQFTDTHICAEKKESAAAIKVIEETIAQEKPDLIIFSGDVVTGKPARPGWDMVLKPVVQSGIPFCVVLGNHDDEQDISREEIARIVTSSSKNNLNTLTSNGQLADITIPLYGAGSAKPKAVLYCMDSHAYSTIDTVKGYGWFNSDQVAWYRKTSAQYTKDNNQKPLPGLAFFHIPLPEYKQAFENKKVLPVGTRLEDECSPRLNTGMFAAFLECGDVMGTFVGHDHSNDYVSWLYGIALCYGRFTGGKTTYSDLPNGSRIIVMKEERYGFDTWIRVNDGTEINRTTVTGLNQKVLYNAFSHNDYERQHPLFDALSYGYNNVEADVHLINGQLYVSHDTPKDLSKTKTLEDLYFKPLADLVQKNNGKVYPTGKQPFYLMIDFKTKEDPTWKALEPLLEKYSQLFCSVENGVLKDAPVLLFISGNRPFKALSDLKVRRAFLDGRIADLDKNYPELLMPVVSNNYKDYFKWNGQGEMPAGEQKQLQSLLDKSHRQGKKLRFWNTPGTDEFNQFLIRTGVDLIGSDDLVKLYRVVK